MNSRRRVAVVQIGLFSLFALSVVVANNGCTYPAKHASVDFQLGEGEQLEFELENAPLELRGYRDWNKANDVPLKMDPGLSALCISPTPAEREALSVEEHGNKYFTVLINDIGWSRFKRATEKPFPVGTMIVKQKHEGPDPESSELLTAMIKRQPGFAPEIGDWEFLVLDGMAEKTMLRGTPDHCVSCHKSKEHNDYVFGYYDLPYFKEDSSSSTTISASPRP